jgi:hypothetical protein
VGNDPVLKRLDALVRLFIEMNKPKGKEKFTEATAARILKSLGMTPTEIARVLGKKSRTEVTYMLYPKKDKTRRSGAQLEPDRVKNELMESK